MVREAVNDLCIDEMREGDIPEICRIAAASFAAPWSEISFFNQVHNPRSVSRVARSRGRIAGYLCASQIIDEGHILDLAVLQEFRNRGIGEELVRHIIDYFRGHDCRIIFLEVRASNSGAIGLYEKAGFRSFAIRKNYYVSPEEDAVIMHLRLD